MQYIVVQCEGKKEPSEDRISMQNFTYWAKLYIFEFGHKFTSIFFGYFSSCSFQMY